MHVEEAKKRQCPFKAGAVTVMGGQAVYLDTCDADACMAWQWSSKKEMHGEHCDFSKDCGYCKLIEQGVIWTSLRK